MSDFFEQDICLQSPFSLHTLRRILIQSSVLCHTILENFVLGLQVLDDAQEKEEWVLTKIRSLVTRAGRRTSQQQSIMRLMDRCVSMKKKKDMTD